MNTRRIAVVFVVLIVVIIGYLLILPKLKNKKPSLVLPSATPGIEDRIEEKFPGLVIPQDAEKIELENVSGGEGVGIATRTEVFADLPDLPIGESYQVFLGNGTKTILLGNLRKAKGGYLLEYDSSKYPGFDQIIIIQGSKHILEGSF